jgi:hypothetical protein
MALYQREHAPANWTLFIADKACNIGHLDSLLIAITSCPPGASRSGQTIWQNIAQLKISGKQAHTLINNLAVIQIFATWSYRMAEKDAALISSISSGEILNTTRPSGFFSSSAAYLSDIRASATAITRCPGVFS